MANIFKPLLKLISNFNDSNSYKEIDEVETSELTENPKIARTKKSPETTYFDALIVDIEQEMQQNQRQHDYKLSSFVSGKIIKQFDPEQALAILIHCFPLYVKECNREINHRHNDYYRQIALRTIITGIMLRHLPYKRSHLSNILQHLLTADQLYSNLYPISSVIRVVERYVSEHELNDSLRDLLDKFANKIDITRYAGAEERRLANRARILSQHGESLEILIRPGEAWSDQALADLKAMPEANRNQWLELLQHCRMSKSARPTKKWITSSTQQLQALGTTEFTAKCTFWFEQLDKSRTVSLEKRHEWEPDPNQLFDDHNLDILKGLIWCCSLNENANLGRLLTKVGILSFKKIPGYGAKASRLGNAVIYSLSEMPGRIGLHQLAVLKMKVKYRQALSLLEKSLTSAASREGITVEECEEMGVPSFGLESVGYGEEIIGEYTAIIRVNGFHNVELTWRKVDGKIQKSIPAIVKEQFKTELKELRGNVKDLKSMLSIQKERLEQLFLKKLTWTIDKWQERYLLHPLVGKFAQKLIWKIDTGNKCVLAMYRNDVLEDVNGNEITGVTAETIVSLWHPITSSVEVVRAWRRQLEKLQSTQPFKQAHREIYILTEAEKETNTYSNRFASHIIKQHQFNALAMTRGWKYKLQGAWDCDEIALIMLEKYNLVAEFWVNGVGEDTSNAGILMYLSTDQVRFHEIKPDIETITEENVTAQRLVPLENIDPLVLSEIFRDVDLYVGVCSVGNDPEWSDGGEDGRYRNYWHSFSFGELTASAITRKEILENLIPKLRFGKQCKFVDRFLIVEGKKRIYKIHLGSGNILMEPNNQYLCIVPDSSKSSKEPKVYLPFEGDRTLSIILAKAQLLAIDDKIKDSTINSQINRA